MRQDVATILARVALGAAFLSAVADRLGLWGAYTDGIVVSWGSMPRFYQDVAALAPWAPAITVAPLAWIVTAAEAALGLALLIGYRLPWTALASGFLLLTFGLSMAAFLSIKLMLNYSVLTCAACAFLLAQRSRAD